mmetsp:Transcript_21372/g.45167  ORF Transcript_21372/g.45167 Transcript_21372/m.45167 type:complete len:200 (+) Transcript_21372:934-1533(+)
MINPAPPNEEEFEPPPPPAAVPPAPLVSLPSLSSPKPPAMEDASGCFSKCASGKRVDRTPILERISSSKPFSMALSSSLSLPPTSSSSSSPLPAKESTKSLFGGVSSKSMPPENSSIVAAFVYADPSIIFFFPYLLYSLSWDRKSSSSLLRLFPLLWPSPAALFASSSSSSDQAYLSPVLRFSSLALVLSSLLTLSPRP